MTDTITLKLTQDEAGILADALEADMEGYLESAKEARGNKTVGLKAGLTSFAKMKQMGVNSPVFGFMTEDYAVPHGGEVKTSELIHPKVEPEIAFVLKRALKGPGCHMGTVLAATDFVLPGIEVIDSRYRDFKFDLKSVIADNTSAARFVVGGQPVKVDGQDLRTEGIVMEKNGQPVAFGAGAAVLGHPAAAVAALANHLGKRGQEIPAGAVILSGGVTNAQAAAFLMALRVRGETTEEITGAVGAMRGKMLTVDAPADAIDIVGTGGDSSGSYNVSTLASIITAACGVPVAKHGNRAASSKTGTADVLMALGVKVGLDPAATARCIAQAGVGFDDVLRVGVYMTDLRDFARMNAVYRSYFSSGAMPARTTVGVAQLLNGGVIEIDCVARLPDTP